MARVFRQTYTKPLPEGAETITRKGQKVARFKDRQGKTTTAPLSQDGSRIILEAQKWYIEYLDPDGKLKKVPGFKDKQATEQYAAELEREAEHVRSGYKPKNHEQLQQPLAEHLADFGQFLDSKDNSKSHIAQTVKRVRRVFDACDFRFWADISAGQISNCLATLTHGGKKLSSQTREYYAQSIRQFCRWMVRDGRADESPVEHLPSIKVVPTFERRASTPQELRKLLAVTQKAKNRYGLTGDERAMLYRFAAETGFRAKEIRSLKVANFDFGGSSVTVVAGYTKNKDKAETPLKQGMLELLRGAMRDKLPEAQAFRMPSRYNMAKMLKADLTEAGIPYEDELGRRFDFHALRHTFITSLRGTPTRVAQSLARHKSSRMTDRYTHVQLLDERAAVEGAIPDYSIPNDAMENKATGTDDLAVNVDSDNKPDDKQRGECSQVPENKALAKPANEFLIRRSFSGTQGQTIGFDSTKPL